MSAVVSGGWRAATAEAIEIDALPLAVRRLHLGEESISAEGRFTVRRSRRRLARLAAWALRLPPDGLYLWDTWPAFGRNFAMAAERVRGR